MGTSQLLQKLGTPVLVSRLNWLINLVHVQADSFIEKAKQMKLSTEDTAIGLSYADPRDAIIRYLESRTHIKSAGLNLEEYDEKMAYATRGLPVCPTYRGMNDLGKENWIFESR